MQLEASVSNSTVQFSLNERFVTLSLTVSLNPTHDAARAQAPILCRKLRAGQHGLNCAQHWANETKNLAFDASVRLQ
jgi:hypothetical protein